MSDNLMIGPIRAWGRNKKIHIHLDDDDDLRGTLQFADETGVGLEEVHHVDRGMDYSSMFIPYAAIAYVVLEEEWR